MKNQKSNLKQNMIYQILYEILVILLPLITSPYLARVLGAEKIGVYSYSYSVAYYFTLFSMLGLKNYGNRAIAQTRDDENKLNQTFSEIFLIHAVVSLICFFAYLIYVEILDEGKVYAAIQGLYVLSAFFDISWFYFGIEKFKMTVLRSAAIRIINIALILLLVHSSEDLWKYCLIMAGCTLLSQIVLWVPLRTFVRFVKPDLRLSLHHLKPMMILFIPSIAVSLYKYMDKIMIGIISSNIQLGYYENSEKVINIPLSMITAFGTVMLPRMSSLSVSHNEKLVEKYIRTSMKYVMCLSFALAFGLAAVADNFAPFFWGDEFKSCAPLIMGLAITIPFISFANIIRTQFLIPQSRDREYMVSVITGAIINFIVNSVFIARFGAIGAVIGTIAAEASVCIVQSYAVRKELPLWSYVKQAIPCLAYGVIMFVVVKEIGKAFDHYFIALIVQIGCGVLIYGALTLLYLLKTKDEMFRSMVDRVKKLKK